MKYFAETEKAVLLAVVVDDYRYERFRTRKMWFPKSQLDQSGIPTRWITTRKLCETFDFEVLEFIFQDADQTLVEPAWNRADHETLVSHGNFLRGCDAYKRMIDQAKQLGIKVRLGFKRETVQQQINDHIQGQLFA